MDYLTLALQLIAGFPADLAAVETFLTSVEGVFSEGDKAKVKAALDAAKAKADADVAALDADA